MITDAHVFDDEHVPDRLLHRDAAVGQLARAFEPALDGAAPGDVLLYGPHGVGKTVLCRHTFDRLQARADAAWAHVETMGLSTAGVIRATLDALGGDPAPTTPREDLCLALRERVDRPTVVVLDEGDELPGGALARLLDVPLVGVVPIVHDRAEWRSRLADDHRQRFDAREVGLDRYTVAELADILDPRARKGLRTSVPRPYLERIADQAAGRARTAIQTLRSCAELAADQDCAIDAVNVRVAAERARTRVRRQTLASLPTHHQVVYALVWTADRLTPGELHDRYEAVADDLYRDRDRTPVGERARRAKLLKLVHYDLVERDGGVLRAVDKAVRPRVEIPD